MNWFGIIAVIIWIIAGALVLANKEVSKFDYGLIWIALLIQLIDNYLTN